MSSRKELRIQLHLNPFACCCDSNTPAKAVRSSLFEFISVQWCSQLYFFYFLFKSQSGVSTVDHSVHRSQAENFYIYSKL